MDTGASCNALKREVFDKLKGQYPTIKTDVCGAEHTHLRSFCGADTKIHGKFVIVLPIEDQFFEVETLVVKDLPIDLIRGQCFLKEFTEETFNFKDNKIQLKEKDNTLIILGSELPNEES